MNTTPVLIGRVFGSLTVLKKLPNWKDRAVWLTRCACGTERKATTYELQSGKIKRCSAKCPAGHDARSPAANTYSIDPEFDA
jgi:hypothetical protein